MHDGQNVFSPGGPFGCWNAEQTADREIQSGRIKATLIVAIDNDGENRRIEFVPPGDAYPQAPSGKGDLYTRYVVENVIPFVNAHYRTLKDPPNTMVAGSSLGGVISLYMGMETDVFGSVGAMSTAICYATNFVRRMISLPRKNLRIYHDIGTKERISMAPANYWERNLELQELLVKAGYKSDNELRFIIADGDDHNEAAWARRLPTMLGWMLKGNAQET
jgi:predicted alpha/beta superfamily hydrolase